MKGALWMVLASTLFAIMNVTVRLGAARVSWAEVAAVRAAMGALVALAVARGRGAPLAIHDRRLSWARSICGTLAMICSFYAMGASAIALGDAVTLNATSPIFVALLAPALLGERSGPEVWVATTVAFIGVALVAGPGFHLEGRLAAVATLGGFFSAMAMIWLRKLGAGARKESPEAVVVHFSTVAAVVTAVIALPTLKVPGPTGIALLVATGVLGGLAQIAMTRAYALERAARLGVIGTLGVVLAHLFGAVLLGERPRPPALLGAALILGAAIALATSAVRRARARA